MRNAPPAAERLRPLPAILETRRNNDPVVNNLFTKAQGITDATQRDAIWGQIDKQVMKDAVIVPIVYAKALIYRPPSLTNVYFNQAYQLNNYAVEGVTSG